MLAQLVRFGFVGGFATLVHVLAALSAKAAFDLPEQRANLVGFSAAVLVSYLGHMRFTFAIREGSSTQFLRFVIMSGLSLAISSGAVWLMTIKLGFSFAAAMGAVAVLVPGASFLAMRFWVFSTKASGVGLPWQGIVISAVVALAMAVLFWGRPLTNDVAWYLISTHDWLAGAALYDVIMEVNPPLNYYFTVPAILIADGFGLSDTNGQYVFIWLMLFASLVWCSAIIRAHLELSPPRQAILLFAIATAILVPSLDNIGQREYHLVVLMMPWLISQLSPRPLGPKQEVATAAFAALGVCLKPHFVLLPLAITLVRCIKARSLRPILSAANLTFLAVGMAYVVLVALVHPSYFSEIVPIAGLVYGAYSATLPMLLGVILRESLFLLLPVLITLMDREGRVNPTPFVALTVAGFLTFLLQAKGFGYHMIPFQTFGLMACFLTLMQCTRLGSFTASTIIAAVGVMGLSIAQGFHKNYSVDQVFMAAEHLGPFDSMIALTPHVFAGPPVALETGAKWASRYPANWLVPGALNRLAHADCANDPGLCDRLRAIAARNRSDNIADMIANKPDLLIVDIDSEYFEEPRFDWLKFMAEDPAWAGVFGNYQEVASSKRYVYYLRNP